MVMGIPGTGDAGVSIAINAIDNFSKTFGTAKTTMAGFKPTGLAIAAGMAAIAAGIVGIGAATVTSAIDFETALTGIKKTVDLTEDEFNDLDKSLRDMTKELPMTYEELAGIAEMSGQLGVKGKDNILKYTKTIAMISTTTNLTAEQASTDFARIANIMNEPIENIDRMGASLVDLGNNSATTETEILSFASRIAGAGKIAGLSTSDIFGISAAFSSVGIQAEAGGTAVQKVLSAMTESAAGMGGETIDNTGKITQTTSAIDEMKSKLLLVNLQMSEFTDKTKESTKVSKQQRIDKYTSDIASLEAELSTLNDTNGMIVPATNEFADVLGLTSEQFSTMFKEDPAGTFKLFVEKLGTEGDKAYAILDKLELGDQRLVRGFLSVGQAGDLMADSLDISSTAWEDNTALTDEAQKRYDTLASQIQMTKNEFALFAVEIGETLMPMIRDTLLPFIRDKLIPTLDRIFDKFVEVVKNDVMPLIDNHLIPAIEKLTEFTVWLKDSWDNLHPSMQEAIKIGLLATIMFLGLVAAAAMLAIMLGIILSPIALVAIAIGALAALGYYLWKNWDIIKWGLSKIWVDIANTVTKVWNGIVNTIASSINSIIGMINELIRGYDRAASKLGLGGIGEIGYADLSRYRGKMMEYEKFVPSTDITKAEQPAAGMTININNLNGFNARDIASQLQNELNKKISMG